MLKMTLFLLVLSLALMAPGSSAKQCQLNGVWVNDVNSRITIETPDAEGKFRGSYVKATSDIGPSPLIGFQHDLNTYSQPIFGLTVNWKDTDSITVFTGQCFLDKTGREILETTWLLRSRVDNIKDNCKATKVGTSIFTRLHTQEQDGIVGDCKADRNTRVSYCPTTCF